MFRNTPDMRIRNPREIELDSASKAKGIKILMLSGAPVRMIGKNRFIVSDIHCELLKQQGIGYRIIKQ